MTNFYRTMAVGATRAYVRTAEGAGAPDYETHLDGLEAGRGFVTNGPMLEFSLGNAKPGQTVEAGEQSWTLDLRAAVPVDSAKVFVNGEVAWRSGRLDAPGRRQYEGTLELPEGGWVTARAYGGDAQWPTMDSYSFAETNPVWIGQVGSTAPAAERRAARDLLRLLDVAEQRLRAGYGDAPIPIASGALRRDTRHAGGDGGHARLTGALLARHESGRHVHGGRDHRPRPVA
jgi:TolB protein